MSFRLITGIGLAAVLSLLLVLGTVHFTGSETQAQEDPPDPPDLSCFTGCMDDILDFDDSGGFDVGDVLAFAAGYENQAPAFDSDGDGDVDVFDVVAWAQEVGVCLEGCLPIFP